MEWLYWGLYGINGKENGKYIMEKIKWKRKWKIKWTLGNIWGYIGVILGLGLMIRGYIGII